MLAHVVISDLCLMLVSLLLEADAHISTVCVEFTTRQLDYIFEAVDDKEEDPDTFYLLEGVSCLVPIICLSEIFLLIRAHEYERAYC